MWQAEVDPGKLQGGNAVIKFWATQGKVELPADSVPHFQFYKNWHVIKQVSGVHEGQ
jgi:hypothetical protein